MTASTPLRRLALFRPRRRLLAALIGATLLGAAAVVAFGTQARPAAAVEPRVVVAAALTVDTISPLRRNLPRTIVASGTVAARDELLIGSDANGVRLLEVRVEVGARVQRGELLARGDDAQLRTQLAQQDALVAQAEVERAQADANFERAENVRDSGLYSVEQVQTRRTSALAARARLDLARAQRRELEVRIAQTRVLAPAAGVISRRGASVGAVMQPGLELFRLIRDDRLDWMAELPEPAIAQVRVGAPVGIRGSDGTTIHAIVRLVAPTIDPRTRSGLVHVAVPPGAALRAGGHAGGEIVVAEASVLTLPEAVLQSRDGHSYVYVLGPGDVARLTRIATGARLRGVVEVSAGLDAGARVISTGAGFVKDGERVRVVPAAKEDQATPTGGATS